MTTNSRNKNLEQRIIRSYILLLRTPENVEGQRFSLLSRHGGYDVRLLEPLQMKKNDSTPFWIELYDRNRKITLDTYGGDYLEQATSAAEAMILNAEQLNTASRQD